MKKAISFDFYKGLRSYIIWDVLNSKVLLPIIHIVILTRLRKSVLISEVSTKGDFAVSNTKLRKLFFQIYSNPTWIVL